MRTEGKTEKTRLWNFKISDGKAVDRKQLGMWMHIVIN